jgi:putative DNA-invertase from lambdoid prophage Rac
VNQNTEASVRAALFVRVSTDLQTVTNQKPDLVQLCRTRGFEIVSVYEETGSAVAKKRPMFDKMRLAAHRGEFDVLVVWAIDRLGRSMIGNMQAVLDLDRLGVKVISVRESWLDMGGPVRDLLVAIFSWVASQERAQLIARTRLGMERARREGKRIGRPPVEVDIARALELRAQGLSIRRIARELRVGASTVHRALRVHDALAGAAVSNGAGSDPQGDPHDSPRILGVGAP